MLPKLNRHYLVRFFIVILLVTIIYLFYKNNKDLSIIISLKAQVENILEKQELLSIQNIHNDELFSLNKLVEKNNLPKDHLSFYALINVESCGNCLSTIKKDIEEFGKNYDSFIQVYIVGSKTKSEKYQNITKTFFIDLKENDPLNNLLKTNTGVYFLLDQNNKVIMFFPIKYTGLSQNSVFIHRCKLLIDDQKKIDESDRMYE
jgi:hypothetical protein